MTESLDDAILPSSKHSPPSIPSTPPELHFGNQLECYERYGYPPLELEYLLSSPDDLKYNSEVSCFITSGSFIYVICSLLGANETGQIPRREALARDGHQSHHPLWPRRQPNGNVFQQVTHIRRVVPILKRTY
jgi:hypothetical protein